MYFFRFQVIFFIIPFPCNPRKQRLQIILFTYQLSPAVAASLKIPLLIRALIPAVPAITFPPEFLTRTGKHLIRGPLILLIIPALCQLRINPFQIILLRYPPVRTIRAVRILTPITPCRRSCPRMPPPAPPGNRLSGTTRHLLWRKPIHLIIPLFKHLFPPMPLTIIIKRYSHMYSPKNTNKISIT